MSDPKQLPPFGRTKLAAKIGAGVLALSLPVIAHFEGTIFKTYRDPVGILTSCTGHTGPELRMGQTWSKAQCDQQLRDDLEEHAEALACVTVPIPEHVQAAFISFAFNAGVSAFCRSTIVRKANLGDLMGACAELSRWTLSKGKELAGLVRRRAAERALCEGRFGDLPVTLVLE